MVCSIADNNPLKKLERELNLPRRCHGKRRECIHGFATQDGDFVMGLPGTALGYCQALFNYAGKPDAHTSKVAQLLKEIKAPWANSHEMFWGHRKAETPAEFIERGIAPLLGTGRVPILITGLDPGKSRVELEAIMETTPAVPENETVLVRVVLNDEKSLQEISGVIRVLLARARLTGAMPKWWPLLQGAIPASSWSGLKNSLGSDWDFVNVAVNPFTPSDVFEEVESQITVAQIPVGKAEGVHADGGVQLHPDVRILGAAQNARYSMPAFAKQLEFLSGAPTLIILGPSLPDWSDGDNQERIASLLPLIRSSCDTLWCRLSPQRRDEVWKLVA